MKPALPVPNQDLCMGEVCTRSVYLLLISAYTAARSGENLMFVCNQVTKSSEILMFVCNQVAKSHEILMLVSKKYALQYLTSQCSTVLIVLVRNQPV